MDPAKIFQIITNSTLLATRLLTGDAEGTPLAFTQTKYCVVVPEDAPLSASLATVRAVHGQGTPVRYALTGESTGLLFSIGQQSGVISLAAKLDYEDRREHEIVVVGEAGGFAAHALLRIVVTDVNDNPPVFLRPYPRVTVIEEDDRDLPLPLAKVEARDVDEVDGGGLEYSISGDGVDGIASIDAFFRVHPTTGEVTQLKALDRDPPFGRGLWQVRVAVRDGQRTPSAAYIRPRRFPRAAVKPSASPNSSINSKTGCTNRRIFPARDESRHECVVPTATATIANTVTTTINASKGRNAGMAQGGGGNRGKSLLPDQGEQNHRVRELKEENRRTVVTCHLDHDDVIVTGRRRWRKKRRRRRKKVLVRDINSVEKNEDKKKPPVLTRTEGGVSVSTQSEHTAGTRDIAAPTTRPNNSVTQATQTKEVDAADVLSWPRHTAKLRHSSLADPAGFSRRGKTFTTQLPSSRIKLLLRSRRRHHWLRGKRDVPGQRMSQRRAILALWEASGHVNLAAPAAAMTRNRKGADVALLSRQQSSSFRLPEAADHKESSEIDLRLPSSFRQMLSQRSDKDQRTARVFPIKSSKMSRNVHSSLGKPRRRVGNEEGNLQPLQHDSLDSDNDDDDNGDNYGYDNGGQGHEGGCVYFTSPYSSTQHLPSGMSGEGGGGTWRQHMVETVLTVVVKDINDNAPRFPNTTIYGQVQENGAANLSVALVAAYDADDASEGTNAKLTYAIEKNVIEERSGEAIFVVHPETGLVRTALCCLDREAAPEYHIQVVAADGGGQKGTCTVIIRVSDIDDNPPRLARKRWDLTVQETWGNSGSANTTLLEIAASDRDAASYFYYRVLAGSGRGWQLFTVRTVGAVGQLYATKPLDYEDETHRQGFKFTVQVTDGGPGAWKDPNHMDSAWISVKLLDVNDNPPLFARPHAHITIREDAQPGTLMASLPAHDPDMGGVEGVDYQMMGGWGALRVDETGDITLWRALDREIPGGAAGEALVVAVDRGRPPLTATATLTLTVTDVNDCAPTLLPPTVFHVPEDAPPTLLGLLKATDADVWELGHGPPFSFSLAPSNPAHILSSIALKFNPDVDSGRGGAELWTTGGLDREAWPELEVGVELGDAGGVTATHTLTVIVDDTNDHPMKPATKTVFLWKTRGGGSEAPLGRVYVNDPDDWDAGDKSYAWDGPPHPLFSLDPRHGTVFASSVVREGRYDLHFRVSDRTWRQRGVAANVTVMVRLLAPAALARAAPISLFPTTPARLARGWTPQGGGGRLGKLLEEVLKVVGGSSSHKVEVVSLYGGTLPHPRHQQPEPHHDDGHHHPDTDRYRHSPPYSTSATVASADGGEGKESEEESAWLPPPPPSACVWLSVVGPGGVFMDPTKLLGLLGLHLRQLEEATKLRMHLGSLEEVGERLDGTHSSSLRDSQPGDPSSAASLASTSLPLQVVDTNVTSLVTPRLSRAPSCRAQEPETCTPSSCLNGGRCLPSPAGNRCVCPGGSKGWRCKVLARTFLGSGWAWVPPLPRCLPTTISMRVLTRHPQGILLYAGPMAPSQRPHHNAPTPMLALQIKNGHPQLLLEGSLEPIKLEVNITLQDGEWHDLHLRLDAQGVALMVDRCGREWKSADRSRCLALAKWSSAWVLESWPSLGPLQVGGMAHSPPTAEQHGWWEAPIARPLHGCLSHLTFNGQLADLGEPASSGGSVPGCRPQEAACPGGVGGCGYRGECVGGLNHPECECEPGWTGTKCSTPSPPAFLGRGSYVRVALSFAPPTAVPRLQLRLRVPHAASGMLVRLATRHRAAVFTLHLRSGIVCASLTGAGVRVREACVEGRGVGDGLWHTISGEQHGDNLVASVDDGDGWRRNESLATLPLGEARRGLSEAIRVTSPKMLLMNRLEGVTVGGVPRLIGGKLAAVNEDLTGACIADVRVSGRHLPLPPAANGTSWGQVTAARHVMRGCEAPDTCANTTCAPPFTCTTAITWDRSICSCGTGRRLVGRNCEDVDECLWQPCLHGGTCVNQRPGYLCLCGPAHAGDHCQWGTHVPNPSALAAPATLAGIAATLVVLLVLTLVLSLRLHRRRGSLCHRDRSRTKVESPEETQIEEKGRGQTHGNSLEEGRGKKRKSILSKNTNQLTFLGNLRRKLPTTTAKTPQSMLQEREEQSVGGKVSGSSGDNTSPGSKTAGNPTRDPTPDLSRDDLRAYAYEGDGSSSGSLTSTISGQSRAELKQEINARGGVEAEGGGTSTPRLVPGFLEVVDLLRNLPEAPGRSSPRPKSRRKLPEEATIPPSPPPPAPPPPPPPPPPVPSPSRTAEATPVHDEGAEAAVNC
ncbi:neural-cadherin-like isoform X2 [Portunus trituberculatus]|uniref:neural-cadherin-like isoform X2 n=1 Tax=Portunus trituberculatus TaxID=210409 RepID=UPI001E1D0E81|nr:neural-cadherin-like isoform X2 [Portunus trituberculatus]